ncbi:MAG TPA: TIGR03560 family F420-dependent LLM class oxidoreductase [Candidatus Binatus sp.]|uniref:TIGR03560 family F420-dependent LLM class oxidoreductase n=1 Tax=Candidatus Binatus sp. TaxID=2811406 RepID=UPI002B463C56|nr:TIGR03560 family F420-dependent LLM class oxidoreductase [Candidatus Binatus sp.]HKN14961.1 TIGR03560 family F420-dependent LLM class oxidoreductase [Candidatus Binatus sp.]
MSKKVQFALFSPQAGQSWHQLEERAHRCEKLGFHSMWLVDHMWTRGMPDLDHHECLALMAGLSAKTDKLRIGTMVICNSYRNPALLAKSLATIDHISNGHLEIGYGAGWMDEEYKAYGYQFPSMGTRLKMFEEGLHIMKAMFTEKRVTYKGRHYSVEEAICNPKPMQQPHPPITIGGAGEKVMLKLVARFADRWNCPAGYESFEHKFNVLKQHCKDVGRDVNTIDVSEQLLVCIGSSDAEVEAKWKAAQMLKPFVSTGIKGTPKQLIEELKKRVAMGITTFVIFFSDFAPPPTLELFAKEVMPAFA